MLLKAFLGRMGHQIVEAANGQEAVEMHDAEAPDLILMDVTMPVLSGYEAASVIKNKDSKRFTPIIFLTGLNDDESLSKCIESGGDDFLSKPFNSILLNAKITSMNRICQMHRDLEAYQERTEQEIELSSHVFNSLTKRMNHQPVPGLSQWAVAAGHFSGDLMVHAFSDSGKLYLMLGDFTGHGFSAAIGALPVSDIFFAMTKRGMSLENIVSEINRKLKDVLPIGHFCATGMVCIDVEQHIIEVFNGGLPSILVRDAHGNMKKTFNSLNMALGVMGASLFTPEIERYTLSKGDLLIIFSDGLSEFANETGEEFGENRVMSALSKVNNVGPLESVRQAISEFSGTAIPHDDVSIMTLLM